MTDIKHLLGSWTSNSFFPIWISYFHNVKGALCRESKNRSRGKSLFWNLGGKLSSSCNARQWEINKPPILIATLGVVFCQHTCSFILSLKVDGNMLGNNLSATGSRNSIKGTIIKTANGTSRKMSAVVRVSCCLSRRDKLFPPASFKSNREQILTSAQSNFVPTQ